MPTMKRAGPYIVRDKRKHQSTRGTYLTRYAEKARIAGGGQFTDESKKWFIEKLKTVSASNALREMRSEVKKKTASARKADYYPKPGNIYTYFYDPKHKKTLPYYDRFPLIILIEQYSDGFLGLNLHYLPPPLRAKLMDTITDMMTDTRFDEKTRITATWAMLKRSVNSVLASICVKRYLSDHLRSAPLLIPATEWEAAIFLPTAQWAKATQSKVYADAYKRYRRGV